jgi:hypothetical protein
LPARLLFVDGPLLEFMEYLHKEQRLKCGFHLIDYIESRGRTPLSSPPQRMWTSRFVLSYPTS